uniref:DENN/MADD domain containing 1A n=1 Tax=Cyprinus carpio TaxID=7962 RepID=A0A8C1TFY1_CYPCA
VTFIYTENSSPKNENLLEIYSPSDLEKFGIFICSDQKFVFDPVLSSSMTVGQVGQNFTFVLTDIESKQRFGFCRLSSGAHSCHCILSYLPWFEVFYKLLNILADYTTKGQDSQWRELLESLHTLNIPDPGVPVHLSVHLFFTVPDPRELPSIPENRNLTEYFVAVDVNNMLHLYASMLYERRILISCSKLSTLTACVHGAAAMLYPMYWQHVYIPVLPQHLIDYCCAPMPYLIGVHSSLMEKVRGMALDDVVLLNVDTNTLETPFDDLQSLPNDVVSSLKNRLRKVSSTTGDGVARAFLKAQAALFGSYRNALHIEPEEPITFSEETFITHRSSTMRQFLQNAIQLQFFKQFIDGRLELLNSGEGFSDQFEEEINMGEYAGSDKTYQWLFTVKKGSGAILNTVKTKANPAMKTVYKFAKDHAKMGIKEVKSRLKQKVLIQSHTHTQTHNYSSFLHKRTRMDLTSGERTRTLPGLKTTNPYSKLWSQREDPSTLLGQESPSWERPLSVPPLEPPEALPPSRESSNPSGEKTEGACITIPRPQGRKTPEPGAVLAPAVTLLRGVKQTSEKEGGVSAGGQEFRQALNMSPHSQSQTKTDLLKPNEPNEGQDLLSLLDPLCGATKNEATPSLTKPPIPPRPNPPNLPALPPPVSLNPFTQPPQYQPQRHYSPVVPGNPFAPAYMPPPGANYFPTSAHPFSVFVQSSAVGVTPTGGAWPVGRVPPSSSSSSSLSTLLDSPAPTTPAQPAQVSTDEPRDPFSDLLTMATTPTVMTKPPKKKVDDLRRRWETFD